MGWRGESRAIKEAQRREERIVYDKCPLCNVRGAHINCYSAKYDRFVMICNTCAQEWLHKPGICYIDGLTVGDQIIKFLYYDNAPAPNYGSNEVEIQQFLPLPYD